jgi:5-methylcytosine-specific restriction endonuclease McrA
LGETVTYWQKLQDPRWQRKRLEVMERANFSCQGCGATDKKLNVHHGYYERGLEPWEYDLATLWCMCDECHEQAGKDLAAVHKLIATLPPEELNLLFLNLAFKDSRRKILDTVPNVGELVDYGL